MKTKRNVNRLLSLSSTILLLGISAPVNALWPVPRQLETGNTTVKLANSFEITTAFTDAPADLQDAIARASKYLKSDGLAPLAPDRGASLASNIKEAQTLYGLVLSLSGNNISSISVETVKSLEDRDEGYQLAIPSDGSNATLSANTTLGLYRGLTTFEQLFSTVDEEIFTPQTPIEIEDTPAFVSLWHLFSLSISLRTNVLSSIAFQGIDARHRQKLVSFILSSLSESPIRN